MKKHEIEINGIYAAKVSGQIAHVRITGTSYFGGWTAINIRTRRTIRIKTARRLRPISAYQLPLFCQNPKSQGAQP